MSHPFEKIFLKALKNSFAEENLVLLEALRLRDKGYRSEEITDVLVKLKKSLIDVGEATIVEEAIEEFDEDT